MKYLRLPNSHPIFEYFPYLEGSDISYQEFKDLVEETLPKIKQENDKFFKIEDIKSSEHVNWRYPICTPFFLKNYIKGKNLLHIGSRKGELCEGFSYFADEITSIERDSSQLEPNRKFKCKRTEICNDIKEYGKIAEHDTYYLYISFATDVGLCREVYKANNTNKTFFLGVPQQLDKFSELMSQVQDFIEETPCTVDYIPILFDESHIPVTSPNRFTEDAEDPDWSDVKTFSHGWGVMLVLKINFNYE